jgi:hypothetical protein
VIRSGANTGGGRILAPDGFVKQRSSVWRPAVAIVAAEVVVGLGYVGDAAGGGVVLQAIAGVVSDETNVGISLTGNTRSSFHAEPVHRHVTEKVQWAPFLICASYRTCSLADADCYAILHSPATINGI